MRFLFLINLTLFISGCFHSLYSQSLSPQARAVLDRLSPEQRAMALQEANRLRGTGNNMECDQSIPSAVPETPIKDADSSKTEEDPEEENQNQILILSELEFSVSEDLKLEKENLETARYELSNS